MVYFKGCILSNMGYGLKSEIDWFSLMTYSNRYYILKTLVNCQQQLLEK